MKQAITAFTLVILCFLCILTILATSHNYLPQAIAAPIYEVACPQGQQPLPFGQTYNPVTNMFRAWVCTDGINVTMPQNIPVNAKTYCNLYGDGGIHDDGPNLQNCINSYPGRRIMLPKTQAAAIGGGGAFTCDYASSVTLTMNGNSQTLEADTGGSWDGQPCISFSAGITGIIIPANCSACSIKGLMVTSKDNGIVNVNDNGIEVRGGESLIENAEVDRFGNHGIYINGQSGLGNNANLWRIYNVTSTTNGADGILVTGGNGNAGVCIACSVIGNGAVGIEDSSLLGNTYIQPHADSNVLLAYKNVSSTASSTWINPYVEGTGQSQLSFVNVVIGGNAPNNWTFGNNTTPMMLNNGWLKGNVFGALYNVADTETEFGIECGKTTDQNCGLVLPDFGGTNRWFLRRLAASNEVQLYDIVANYERIGVYGPIGGGDADTQINGRGATGDVDFNVNHGRAVSFFGGGAAATAGISANGTATVTHINGRTTATAPSIGSCTGLGTTGTCTLATGSTDMVGAIVLTPGGTGIVAAGSFTLTFGITYGTNDSTCTFQLHNGTGSWNARASIIKTDTSSTANIVAGWDDNAVNLGSGLTFEIDYICGSR